MSTSTFALQQKNAKHLIQSFSDLSYTNNPEETKIISRADGVYIYDNDGKKILDSMSGLWCVNMGYGQKSIIDAVNEQMKKLVYYNNFFGTSHPSAIKLSEMITDKTPEAMNKVYFCGSGSEANDTVVRLVRHYWAAKGKPSKSVIISRKNAYHGSTMAGASLGGMSAMHSQGGLPIPDIEHVDQPYYYDACVEAGGKINANEFGLKVAQSLANKIDELGEDRVAAFIAEPIQGAGGVIIPPKTYWPAISKICKERNILLVADEVICGFGRTGQWFGSNHFNFEPDLMPFAKGVTSGYLPVGGVIVRDDIVDVLVSAKQEFAHGFTYSGHPTCMAAAIANLELMEKTNILDQVKNNTGPYLSNKWKALEEHELVGEARSVGMLAAIEIVKDKENCIRFENSKEIVGRCRDFCYENGLVMRAIANKMVIAPPLICETEHLDEIIEKVWKCLDLTSKSLK
ncbi:MAG: aminotransferase [Candidatus Pseudothioglobus sp.]|jgi:putrescine aminotransferase|tara:strand:+ start:340 stop:1713 length:1374 start_codon:yes stop_codon:yes gene_type:complete